MSILSETMEAYESIKEELKELEAVKNPTEEQKEDLEYLRYQEERMRDVLDTMMEGFACE
jgi:septal ring factor EnvC (AmiA/AmiB activator)